MAGMGRQVSAPSSSGLPLGVELGDGSFCHVGLSLHCPSTPAMPALLSQRLRVPGNLALSAQRLRLPVPVPTASPSPN